MSAELVSKGLRRFRRGKRGVHVIAVGFELRADPSSACLSEIALEAAPAHQKKFTRMMVRCMTFVMGKLGAKGVFHNTLLFSGRFLVST
jgi:hypothetical protein